MKAYLEKNLEFCYNLNNKDKLIFNKKTFKKLIIILQKKLEIYVSST